MNDLRRLFSLAALGAGALLAGGCAHQDAATSAAANPNVSTIGDFPDPFILPDKGAYYAYATNANNLSLIHI